MTHEQLMEMADAYATSFVPFSEPNESRAALSDALKQVVRGYVRYRVLMLNEEDEAVIDDLVKAKND